MRRACDRSPFFAKPVTCNLLSALIAKLKAVRGKSGFRAGSYAIPNNVVNNFCLFVSATFVMICCFLVGVLVDQTWSFFGSKHFIFKANNDVFLRILKNFQQHLFWRTSAYGCFLSNFRKKLCRVFFLNSHFQNYPDLVLLQKYQSLSNQSFEYNSMHMPFSNLTPTSSFEPRFHIFIINVYNWKSKYFQ